MRLIDADELQKKAWKAERFNPNMLVVGLGFVLDATTIEAPRDWTPCAEGLPLPKDGEPCYITVLKTKEDGRKHLYVVEGYFYSDKGIWFDKGGWKINSKAWRTKAIAWMSKQNHPDPYNPDRKED